MPSPRYCGGGKGVRAEAAPGGGLSFAANKCNLSVGLNTLTEDIAANSLAGIPLTLGSVGRRLNEVVLSRNDFDGRAWRRGSEVGHVGRGRTCCPEGQPLKTSGLSLRQVFNPRLPGPSPGMGLEQPYRRATP